VRIRRFAELPPPNIKREATSSNRSYVSDGPFLCRLTEKDTIVLSEKIKDIIHHTEDQVILIKLGLVDGKHDSLPEKWQVLGVPLSISDHSVMIY